MKRTTCLRCIYTALATILASASAFAQLGEEDNSSATHDFFEFDELTIRAQRNPVSPTTPTVTAKITQEELRGINMTNPEDAIKYMPNLFIRKRFIGDRNGVLSIRTASPFQNGRTLVYVDGVTISDFIQDRFNAPPKWQIVAPEEIVSTEIIYGPYSALYSGNAMNGVVNIHTRQPDQRTTTIQSSYFTQSYDSYGVDETFDGFDQFLSFGDKFGKLSVYGFYQHHESDAQPQSIADREGGELTPTNAPDNVSGIIVDRNSRNETRYVLGATAWNETDQDLWKLKLAYDITETIRAQLTLGYWETTDVDEHLASFVYDANGSPVYEGSNLVYGGFEFSIPQNLFGRSVRERQDLLLGFTLEGELFDDWDFQTVYTMYDVIKDERRRSDENPIEDSAGRVQEFGDTYWQTFDAKVGTEALLGNEDVGLAFGYQLQQYRYDIKEWNSSNWRAGVKDEGLRNDDAGKTDLHALFAQVDWQFHEQFTVTAGVRQEWWEARDGHDNNNIHPDRDESDISPKFSLLYEPNEVWDVRLALAHAVRYPVITEIFSGDVDLRSQLVTNPQLEPEKVFAKQIIVERAIEKGAVRVAYFHNDEKDTIWRDSVRFFNNLATPPEFQSTAFFVNIDEVTTQGVEFSVIKESFFTENLDMNFNVSFNDTEIEQYDLNPAFEGNEIPRVPDTRIGMLTTYHVTDAWDTSVGMRYATDAHNLLSNEDTHQDSFGGISDFLVWDFKTSYQFESGFEVAFGVDNIFSEEYWMAHPFPERTYYFEGKMVF